jgi:hypothetical protein
VTSDQHPGTEPAAGTPDGAQREPGLVLRMWGTPPAGGARPATIDAHPMISHPGGWSLTSPGPDVSPLRDLVLRADAAPDGSLTRWRAEYSPVHSPVDEARAAAMLRVLSGLRTSLEAAGARRGPPAGFGDYLARAAAALGITDPAPFAVHVPGARSPDARWRYLTRAELRDWLPAQARRVIAPSPGPGR